MKIGFGHDSCNHSSIPLDSGVGPCQPTLNTLLISSDRTREAIAVATRLAERFAVEASVRDRERRLPVAELDEFSASGLWGITIPKAYGGAECVLCRPWPR